MAFREPRTPGSKTPGGRRGTMDNNAPRNSFAPTSSSVGMRRSSSVFGSNLHSSTAFKDKRNLIAPATKQAMIQKIFEFCNGEFSMEDVKQPTRRTFLTMFEYLYGTLHDCYALPKTPDEQNAEIIRIFKTMGYPVPIKGSTLQSIGAPTSWPHLLGALTWLLENIDFYNNIRLDQLLMSSDYQNNPTVTALRYHSDAAISKGFFDAKKDNMNEHEKESVMQELVSAQLPIFKQRFDDYQDIGTKMEESELRVKHLEQELAALEEEKQSDSCPVLQDEIKTIDLDVKSLEQFLEEAKTNEEKIRMSSDNERREIHELEMKVAELNAVIKSKQRQIEEQTKRTGLDSAAIRALAMEKESLNEQLKEIMSELEKLSKFKYNLAPRATTAFVQEQAKYRRLVQRAYDLRATYLDDDSTPLLDTIPKDIKSLIELLSSDVRRLFSRTKTELESKLHDVEANTRRLAADERRVHDDETRVDKENRAEEIAMEKEDRARLLEREDWERESNLKEREMQSAEVEKETILGSSNEAGHLNQQIHAAQLDLDEMRKECERKKTEFDSKLEERAIAAIETHDSVILPRRAYIENEMNKLEKFNKERAAQMRQ